MLILEEVDRLGIDRTDCHKRDKYDKIVGENRDKPEEIRGKSSRMTARSFPIFGTPPVYDKR